MKEPTVVRLAETERVSFGPLSHYQPIIGNDEGTTPVRTGIQTAQPGYEAPLHSHPYVEIIHILEGSAEAWIEGRESEPIVLEQGDTLDSSRYAAQLSCPRGPGAAPARHPRLAQTHRRVPGRRAQRRTRLPRDRSMTFRLGEMTFRLGVACGALFVLTSGAMA